MNLDNFLRSCYIIGILIIIAIIVMFGVKNASRENGSILIYTVEQKTCSGKSQYRYEKCINLRIENGFTTFDVLDNNRICNYKSWPYIKEI